MSIRGNDQAILAVTELQEVLGNVRKVIRVQPELVNDLLDLLPDCPLNLLLPLPILIQSSVALIYDSRDLAADVGSELDDLRPQLFEVVVDVSDFLLLAKVRGFQLS